VARRTEDEKKSGSLAGRAFLQEQITKERGVGSSSSKDGGKNGCMRKDHNGGDGLGGRRLKENQGR